MSTILTISGILALGATGHLVHVKWKTSISDNELRLRCGGFWSDCAEWEIDNIRNVLNEYYDNAFKIDFSLIVACVCLIIVSFQLLSKGMNISIYNIPEAEKIRNTLMETTDYSSDDDLSEIALNIP